MKLFNATKCVILIASGLASGGALGQYVLKPVVKENDLLPGGTGWHFTNANAPMMNSRGDVFLPNTAVNGGALRGVFAYNVDGTSRCVATTLDSIPTVPSGSFVPYVDATNCDETGAVAVSYTVYPPGGSATTRDAIIDRTGSISLIFSGQYLSMSNGLAAFAQYSTSPYFYEAIVRGTSLGPWSSIVTNGTHLPGTLPLATPDGLRSANFGMARDGTVFANISFNSRENGIYYFSPVGAVGLLGKASPSDTPLPYRSVYDTIVSGPCVSDSGNAAFTMSYLDGGSPQRRHWDLFLDIFRIATFPEAAGEFASGNFNSAYVTSCGDGGYIMVDALWSSRTVYFAANILGITKIIGTGDPLPGLPTLTLQSARMSRPNANGTVVSHLYASNGREYLFTWNAASGFTRVLAVGDTIEWAPGDVRVIQLFSSRTYNNQSAGHPCEISDDGVITFYAQVSAGATSGRNIMAQAVPTSILVATVTLQPTPQSACPGGSAVFTSTASAGSSSPLTKWQAQISGTWADLAEGPLTVAGSVIATISGSQTPTLSITAASTALATTLPIRAKWFNAAGVTLSSAATLTIHDASEAVCCPCAADFDNSGGTPDASDIDVFFTAWLAGDQAADADCSGGTPDASDIDVFFSEWLAGGC